MTYKEFLADTRTQDAVIRNLEIIGEATIKLSEGLRNRYPSVPWKEMAGARDRLIHNYFGVDIEVVWKISLLNCLILPYRLLKSYPRTSLSTKRIQLKFCTFLFYHDVYALSKGPYHSSNSEITPTSSFSNPMRHVRSGASCRA